MIYDLVGLSNHATIVENILINTIPLYGVTSPYCDMPQIGGVLIH